MNNKVKKVLSLMLAMLIIASCLALNAFAGDVYLSNDDYGDYSGNIDGISGTVVGEYRTRYGSNILDRYVLSVIGHKSTSQTTKVVAVGGYETSSGKTRYIEIDTLKSSDGSRIANLSQTYSSTAWKTKDSNEATWYATKTSISGAITSYIRYECIYSSSTTYVGLPHLYNVN